MRATFSNYTGTVSWRYASRTTSCSTGTRGLRQPDRNDQTKIYNNRITTGAASDVTTPGNNISGCVGDKRNYVLDTTGFDGNNTTRFELGGWRNALTYGGDNFQDDVDTDDPAAIPTSPRLAESAPFPAPSCS